MAYRFTKISPKRRHMSPSTTRPGLCLLQVRRLSGQADKFRLADDSEVSLVDFRFSSLHVLFLVSTQRQARTCSSSRGLTLECPPCLRTFRVGQKSATSNSAALSITLSSASEELGESRLTKLCGTHLAESTKHSCEVLLGLESTCNGYIENACVFFYQ
jgi:hypothetical protein